MWQGRTVSVVFPVFNEEKNILDAIKDVFATGYVDEIITVDNNSLDGSAKLIQTTGARLLSETQQGYGYALRRGIQEARGDLIILSEPDGTFMGKDIIKLLAYCDDFDMVLGTRTTRELIWGEANMGIFLRYGNYFVAKMLELLFNTPSISDCGCTLRLINRHTASHLQNHLTVGESHFLPEMIILGRLLNLSMIEVPVNYRGRIGESKITGSLKTTIKVGLHMIALILHYRLTSWMGLGRRLGSYKDQKVSNCSLSPVDRRR